MDVKTIYHLNDYCISLIFEYLDINDWMKLCQTTIRFREIVLRLVVPRMPVDLVGPHVDYPMNTLLRTFGKTMTSLIFDYECVGPTGTFEMFLELLLDYCEPGLIKRIMIWNMNKKIQNRFIDPDLVLRSAPYFKNLVSLRLHVTSYESVMAMAKWLNSIPGQRVDSLLFWYWGEGGYDFKLNLDSFPNLRKLSIELNIRQSNTLTNFLRKKSHLKSLFYSYLKPELLKDVVNHFPDIECLGLIDLRDNLAYINVLGPLKHLKSVSVTGNVRNHREFDNIFRMLNMQKSIKNVAILLINHSQSETDDVLSFERLNHHEIGLEYMHFKARSITWTNETESYVKYLFSNVFQVKILQLRETIPWSIITSIVQKVECLECIAIEVDAFPAQIYKQLVIERRVVNNKMGTMKQLTIYVKRKVVETCILQSSGAYYPQIIALQPSSSFKSSKKDLWYF